MKSKGKIKQDRILTAIVGSYPKPKYLFSQSGRKLLDSLGLSFVENEKKVGKAAFAKLLDKAAQQAVNDQNNAGIDIVTDGEERRGHYVLDILRRLSGIDFTKLKQVSYRGGIIQRRVPTVTAGIVYKGRIIADEFKFTKIHTKAIVKVGLPGPSTVIDCIADEFYQDDLEAMAHDYAKAIHHEVAALIQSGCQIIQFDDPVLLRFPDRAKAWGLKALEQCFAGFEDQATFIVHICRGYPNKPLEKKGISYKANKEYYRDILTWLADSNLDVVSIEGAQGNLDLSVLTAIGKKTVMLGVLDVGVNTFENVSSLVKRGQEALQYVRKEQLIFGPDCGMIELTRTAAKKKLQNMALAVKALNETN